MLKAGKFMVGKSNQTENFQQPKVPLFSYQNSEHLLAGLLVKVLEIVNKQNQTPISSSNLNSMSPQEITSTDINGKKSYEKQETNETIVNKKAFIVKINNALISFK